MDPQTKVTFHISIGIAGERSDTFTLEELGYDPNTVLNINAFLEDSWNDWADNLIDGGWVIGDKGDE